MSSAHTILCIGYGFNDRHVHQKLIQKARNPRARFIVAAKALTQNTKKFLKDGGCQNYIAIEEAAAPEQSLFWMSDRVDPVTYAGVAWSTGGLYKLVT